MDHGSQSKIPVGSWRDVRGRTEGWRRVWRRVNPDHTFLHNALYPYALLVQKLEDGFSWPQRLFILFKGKLPDDF
jgi:hypothetical protein